jgi:hypothetical protein
MRQYSEDEILQAIKRVLKEEIATTTPSPPSPGSQPQPVEPTKQEKVSAEGLIKSEWDKAFAYKKAPAFLKVMAMTDLTQLTNADNQAIIVDGRPKLKSDGSNYTLFDQAAEELAQIQKDMLWGYEQPARREIVKFWYNKYFTALKNKARDRLNAATSGGNRYDMSAINARLERQRRTGRDVRGKQPGMPE